MMEQLISIKEVSRITGVKECTIRAWVFQRRIPFVRIGRLIRFRPSELNQWINKGKSVPYLPH